MRLKDSLYRYAKPLLLGGAIAAAPALAFAAGTEQSPEVTPTPTEQASNPNSPEAHEEERKEMQALVTEATEVVQAMRADPKVAALLDQAKGVYIVPDFGRAALGVGGEGGEGVMLSQVNGKWAGPAFYDMGGLTIGLEAGVSGGQVAFILLTDKAVENFTQSNSFSLTADAGYNVLNYEANAGTAWGRGDVVTWSDTEGLFAGAGVGVSDIRWNPERNARYFGHDTSPAAVITGKAATDKGSTLKGALSG